MPPPNVTGILHFGHVLNHTIQDVYIRWNRLQGRETCWFPGLDHAGIATQTKVEQELKKEGKTRHDLGREAFIERTYEWKEKYGGIILEQLRRLGNSSDWDRTLFTMDPSAVDAVREVFIQLFDDGLIYRGKRIINWSPLAQSALSDEEVVFKEVREHLYTLKYKLSDGSGELLVATVRPETIFADVAVAVNPRDERYAHLIGQTVVVPLSGQHVPIIADDYADPTFGTGVVKITPAHDPNDYEIGLRHNLPMPQCINADATLNERAGAFAGMDRFVARKAVVLALQEAELVAAIEDYTHNVGFSERGGEAVEPYLSDQWFVRMQPLAEPALKAVQNGEIRFYPDHWVKTYEHWMTNVRDWCISRQLWWGHRIPVYYAPDGRWTAARSEDEARIKLALPEGTQLVQDPDVLDTWFSSWLWPMTTMGWAGEKIEDMPVQSRQLFDYYVPTNLLVTGPDIIFFWVARMIMATVRFGGRVPFRDVYFTSIIRDAKGRKLSKSLGNSPDPLDVMSKYGSDAVRFTMIYLAPLGTDVRLDIDVKTQDIPSMELGRNFANKVWNAARFLQMKSDGLFDPSTMSVGTTPSSYSDESERWIISRYHSTVAAITEALAEYRITEYARTLYDFIWRDFCDWYVEVVKVRLNVAANDEQRRAILSVAFGIFEGALKLLHPVMPFVTEELWHGVFGTDETSSINVTSAPVSNNAYIDHNVEQRFELLQNVVESVRRQRSDLNIPPSERLPITMNVPSDIADIFEQQQAIISAFCRASTFDVGTGLNKPSGSVADVTRGVETFLVVEGRIDLEKEKARLLKEAERLKGLMKGLQGKLDNPGFLAKAAPDVIEGERKKLSDWTAAVESLERNAATMG